jgi:23S rRNA pseudouridine955/2504/2580 synthase/23S rRNA pseudouridine1911/1915/1917 synthase
MSKEKLSIIHESNNYIFVNKPSGMLSILDRHDPTLPSAIAILRKKYGDVFIVHRIDKDTSGCLVFAKNESAHRHASIAFETRQVTKKYLGIVHGAPPQDSGTIKDKIMDHPVIKGKMIVNAKEGKEAITNYTVIEKFSGYALVEFHILTGRMHQIRIHCQNLGCPLLCDPIYGKDEQIFVSKFNKKYALSKYEEEEKPILNRLALHSASIAFKNEAGEEECASAPLFKDMSATLQQMRKWLKK